MRHYAKFHDEVFGGTRDDAKLYYATEELGEMIITKRFIPIASLKANDALFEIPM